MPSPEPTFPFSPGLAARTLMGADPRQVESWLVLNRREGDMFGRVCRVAAVAIGTALLIGACGSTAAQPEADPTAHDSPTPMPLKDCSTTPKTPKASLSYCDLRGAKLDGAQLAEADLTAADLSGASLVGATLTGTVMFGAVLTSANLTNANMISTDLYSGTLTNANLTNANLTDGDLYNADLKGARMTGTDLKSADLSYAKLAGANPAAAKCSNTKWTNGVIVAGPTCPATPPPTASGTPTGP
ncbi:MAG: pentapeptide repeat-containing protein [Actinomycetes bacterium]